MIDGNEVVLYFCNSNIYPREEYDKRLHYARKLANILDVVIEEDQYDHELWLSKISGYENEPERGKRCSICFDFSLARASTIAKRLDIPLFTTTLTISPHKSSYQIFDIGKKYDNFYPVNFKKQNGFLRSLELSDKNELYRQSYCGCEFSLRNQKLKSTH